MIFFLTKSNSKHFRAKRQGFLPLLALTVWIVAGCGGGKSEVTGTVSYRGKPLQSGIVSFFDKEDHIVGTSSIEEGKYTIQQVPPGAVKITVTTVPVFRPTADGAKPSGDNKAAPVEDIDLPPKYGQPDQSGLTYEVKPGKQEHAIDLN